MTLKNVIFPLVSGACPAVACVLPSNNRLPSTSYPLSQVSLASYLLENQSHLLTDRALILFMVANVQLETEWNKTSKQTQIKSGIWYISGHMLTISVKVLFSWCSCHAVSSCLGYEQNAWSTATILPFFTTRSGILTKKHF